MKKFVFFISIIIIFILPFFFVSAKSKNIAVCPDFEGISDNNAGPWRENVSNNKTTTIFRVDNSIRHSGKTSISLENTSSGYSSYSQVINVKPGSIYRISCWVRAENIGTGKVGAILALVDDPQNGSGILGYMNNTNNTWAFMSSYIRVSSPKITLILGLGDTDYLNTGKAWFDDIIVQEFFPDSIESYRVGFVLYFIIFLLACYLIAPYIVIKPDTNTVKAFNNSRKHNKYGSRRQNKTAKDIFPISPKKELLLLCIMLASGFLIRLVLAPGIEGLGGDINCWRSWSSTASNNGLINLYTNPLLDRLKCTVNYPPVYVYVLLIIGKLAGYFNLYVKPAAYIILLKLPAMISDMACSYFLYRFSRKRLNGSLSLIVAALFAFNPEVILNSAVWGQVDSILALLLFLGLVQLLKGHYAKASSFWTLSILTKPQGIIILPLMLFKFIREKRIRPVIISLISVILVLVAVTIPYIFSFGPFWVFKLLLNTISGSDKASMNAFNLYTLFGANFIKSSETFLIFSYRSWGFIFIALIVLFTAILYFKSKSPDASVFSAILLYSGVFVLSSGMHERYLFPVIILVLLAFAYTTDLKVLYMFMAFNFTIYLNNHRVLFNSLEGMGNPNTSDFILMMISLFNIMLLCYFVYYCYKTLIKDKDKG